GTLPTARAPRAPQRWHRLLAPCSSPALRSPGPASAPWLAGAANSSSHSPSAQRRIRGLWLHSLGWLAVASRRAVGSSSPRSRLPWRPHTASLSVARRTVVWSADNQPLSAVRCPARYLHLASDLAVLPPLSPLPGLDTPLLQLII